MKMFDDSVMLREIKGYGHNILQQRGLRLGDDFKIFPCEGRKKAIKLNRTRYKIKSNREHKVSIGGNEILLPNLTDREFEYELFLCMENKKDGRDGKNARYAIKSANGMPFRLNGNFSFFSFLERGDQLDLGYNKLMAVSGKADSPEFQVTPKEGRELLEKKNLLESELNILIEGETGSGKTELAKMIHEESGRKGGFVHLNLSSFSENLIESELFGHVKGAFTGAVSAKRGAFREASYGTLFLDEIDSLSIALQTKLLLSLDSRLVRPVGGEDGFQVNTRLIFASGKKLGALLMEGKMRNDFYYRISSGYRLELAPLRRNPDRIGEICNWFMLEENVVICPRLAAFYKEYSWPGNIRQLIGHLKRKKVLCRGRKISYDETDDALLMDPALNHLAGSRDKVEKLSTVKSNYIRHVYMLFNENIELASNALGVSRNTVKSNLRQAC